MESLTINALKITKKKLKSTERKLVVAPKAATTTTASSSSVRKLVLATSSRSASNGSSSSTTTTTDTTRAKTKKGDRINGCENLPPTTNAIGSTTGARPTDDLDTIFQQIDDLRNTELCPSIDGEDVSVSGPDPCYDSLSSDDSDAEQNHEDSIRNTVLHWHMDKVRPVVKLLFNHMPKPMNYCDYESPFYVVSEKSKRDFAYVDSSLLPELAYTRGIHWLRYATSVSGPNAHELLALLKQFNDSVPHKGTMMTTATSLGIVGGNTSNISATSATSVANGGNSKEMLLLQKIRAGEVQKVAAGSLATKITICVYDDKVQKQKTKDIWPINVAKLKGNRRYIWECITIAIYHFVIFFAKFVQLPIVLQIEDHKFRTYFEIQQSFMKHVIVNNTYQK